MTVLLYPGAGTDSAHRSMVAIAEALEPHRCVRADFPYRREGRTAPDRAPKLLASIRDEIADLDPDEPLILAGRSMGGRMCSMIAAGADGSPPPPNLIGLVCIAYPLHPPGKPERLRVEHLPDIKVPTLFVSGTRDQFGSPAELTEWTATMPRAAKVAHLWIEGRGHDLKYADHTVGGAVRDFVERLT